MGEKKQVALIEFEQDPTKWPIDTKAAGIEIAMRTTVWCEAKTAALAIQEAMEGFGHVSPESGTKAFHVDGEVLYEITVSAKRVPYPTRGTP